MAGRFWVGGTGTWDAADTTHWASSSNGAGGQSVPGSSDTVTFDGSSGGGTVTVNTTVGIQTLTMGAFTGTLDFATNNNNVTLSASFSGTGTGTRTLNMGNGTWTLSSNAGGSIWDCTVVTNFTLNCNSSTIAFTGSAPTLNRTFVGGGKTYNIVSIAATTTGFITTINNAGTFATLNLTAPVNIGFQSQVTLTITNAFTWTGSAGNEFYLINNGTGTAAVIVATGGGAIQYAAIAGLTFTTGTVTATNSYNLRSNTGVTITAPASGGARVIGS